eukprot:827163-Pelagomonas_calceolata.AAC.2
MHAGRHSIRSCGSCICPLLLNSAVVAPVRCLCTSPPPSLSRTPAIPSSRTSPLSPLTSSKPATTASRSGLHSSTALRSTALRSSATLRATALRSSTASRSGLHTLLA